MSCGNINGSAPPPTTSTLSFSILDWTRAGGFPRMAVTLGGVQGTCIGVLDPHPDQNPGNWSLFFSKPGKRARDTSSAGAQSHTCGLQRYLGSGLFRGITGTALVVRDNRRELSATHGRLYLPHP